MGVSEGSLLLLGTTFPTLSVGSCPASAYFLANDHFLRLFETNPWRVPAVLGRALMASSRKHIGTCWEKEITWECEQW